MFCNTFDKIHNFFQKNLNINNPKSKGDYMSKNIELWQRQKSEASKSFTWFKEYRDLGASRSLQKVVDKITAVMTKDDNIEEIIPIPTITQLTNLSSKWSWVERCRAYDNHLDEQRLQIRKEQYLHLEDDLIETGKKLAIAVKENIEDLNDNIDDSRATSIANSLESAAKAYDKSVSNLRLLHGQSTSINDNNTNLDGKIEADIDIQGKIDKTQELLSIDEFRKYEIGLLNAIKNKRKKSDK